MTKTIFKICTLLFLIQAFTPAAAQDPQQKKMTPYGRGYLEYLPAGYESSTELYPAIIFLHGSGERGLGTVTDLAKVSNQGPPKLIKYGHKMCFTVNGKTECFIVLSPQTNDWSWQYDVVPFVQYALQTYRIDPNRVYLTGLSMGGEGTWLGASYSDNAPNYFAAIAPMAGRAAVSDGTNVAAKKIPVWAFHGTLDTAIPIAAGQRPITGMIAALASPAPILTIYPDADHSKTWIRAYTPDHTYHNPNVYEWFLTQRRAQSNLPPVVNAGVDLNLTLPISVATLTATASDPNGTIASYAWSQVSGPSIAVLTNITSPILSVASVIPGTYTFRVAVTDNQNATATDQVSVVVTSNQLPTVEAGVKQYVTLPANSATFTAQASDADGTIVSYSWTRLGAGTVTMAGTTTSTLSVSGASIGTHVFRIEVKDNKGGTAADTVRLKVSAPLTSSRSTGSVLAGFATLDAAQEFELSLTQDHLNPFTTTTTPSGSYAVASTCAILPLKREVYSVTFDNRKIRSRSFASCS
jgi:dienelactone hydrolase